MHFLFYQLTNFLEKIMIHIFSKLIDADKMIGAL